MPEVKFKKKTGNN